jgi:hypothetical protein
MQPEDEKLNSDENKNGEPAKHHTWIENIVENIQKLDTEFPLSGGETEEDFENADDSEEGGENEEQTTKTSFNDDLETEFPLSGGEVER